MKMKPMILLCILIIMSNVALAQMNEEDPQEEVQAEEVQAEEVQAEEVQAEEVQAEEVQAEEVQAEEVQTEEVQAEDTEKGLITLTEDGKGFLKDGEKFLFGENFQTLEKAVRNCPRARREIIAARGKSRGAGILAAIAGGMSGTGIGIYLGGDEYGSKSERSKVCWTFQGLCCGFAALAVIPTTMQKNHIENAVKYYNEDLKAGKLIQ
ncbi:hypothetical protein JW835_09205 [bacterium]|nr:hypothetical protein [bacterium]